MDQSRASFYGDQALEAAENAAEDIIEFETQSSDANNAIVEAMESLGNVPQLLTARSNSDAEVDLDSVATRVETAISLTRTALTARTNAQFSVRVAADLAAFGDAAEREDLEAIVGPIINIVNDDEPDRSDGSNNGGSEPNVSSISAVSGANGYYGTE
uniref:Band_7_C domain-containing protein n=1 Tax=Meloidogyne hapla TaxID=6305 RepID=A0A1I8BFP8_MELHA